MRAENTAAIGRAQAVWPDGRVYVAGGVPANPVTPYLVIKVDSGLRRNYRGTSASSRLHRISAQGIGKTYNEAAIALEKADLAFLDHRLVIDGKAATPARDESATDVNRDPDGGVLMYGARFYTFTTNPSE